MVECYCLSGIYIYLLYVSSVPTVTWRWDVFRYNRSYSWKNSTSYDISLVNYASILLLLVIYLQAPRGVRNDRQHPTRLLISFGGLIHTFVIHVSMLLLSIVIKLYKRREEYTKNLPTPRGRLPDLLPFC